MMIDIIAATHRLLETSGPEGLVSGYRSSQTNAMLRSRGLGVASNTEIGCSSSLGLKRE